MPVRAPAAQRLHCQKQKAALAPAPAGSRGRGRACQVGMLGRAPGTVPGLGRARSDSAHPRLPYSKVTQMTWYEVAEAATTFVLKLLGRGTKPYKPLDSSLRHSAVVQVPGVGRACHPSHHFTATMQACKLDAPAPAHGAQGGRGAGEGTSLAAGVVPLAAQAG